MSTATQTKKPKKKEDQVEQTVVSTEPPPALTSLLKQTELGTYTFNFHPSLFHPDGKHYLEEVAAAYNSSGPRATTPAHLERIKMLSNNDAIKPLERPLVAVLAPEDWRVQQRLPNNSQTFSLNESTSYLTGVRGSRSSSIPAEDSERLVLILLDGRAREKVLLEELAKKGQKRTISVKLHSADVLKDRQAFLELLHGTNFRHSFSSLAVKPGLDDYLRSIERIRQGGKPGRLPGGLDSGVQAWFYSYTSSENRSQIAHKALHDPIIMTIAEREKASRISSWFGGFGAASPLLFSAIDDTLTVFNLIDPSRTNFTVTFFWFLSKLVLHQDVFHPFGGGSGLSTPKSVPEIEYSCLNFARTLREVAQSCRSNGIVQLKKFTSYFGATAPPWFAVKATRIELAREIVGQLEGLAAQLDNFKPSDLDPESRFADRFVVYEDLISFNPRSHGTEFTRWIALCESHVLTPLWELFSAYIQLSRDDPSLRLPKQYEDTFKDPEPFLHELMLVGDGLKGIKANGRRIAPTGSWFEPKSFSEIYRALIRLLWIHHRRIIVDILASKARTDALTDDQQQVLLEHFLDKSFQNTPQGEVIKRNLHLAFFRVEKDRSFAPTLPPSLFERCIAWLRPAANAMLTPLNERLEARNSSNLFASYLDLIKKDDRFPVRDSAPSLGNLVDDLVVKQNVKEHQTFLPLTLDDALSKLECFKSGPLDRPESSDHVRALLKGSQHGDQKDVESDKGRDWERAGEKGGGGKNADEIETNGEKCKGEVGAIDVDGCMEDLRVEGDGEDEVDEENEKVTTAQSKQARKKGKAVVRELDRQPDLETSGRLRCQCRSTTFDTLSNLESSSRIPILTDDQPLPPDEATVDPRAWFGRTIGNNARENGRAFDSFVGSGFLPIAEVVKRFRQSNRYPPLGTSFDPVKFDLDLFAQALRTFIHDKGGWAEDEEGFQPEQELDEIPEGLWHVIICQAFVTFFYSVFRSGMDEEIFNFWQELVGKTSKSG